MMLSSLLMTHALFAQHVRIAVVSYYDGDDIHEKENEGRRKGIRSLNVQQMNTICEQNHRAYTDMYNYKYVNPHKRAQRWSRLLLNGKRFKLVLILRALHKYDYVLWVDADVVFQTTQSVQEWILRMGLKDMLVAADIGGDFVFNSGVVLLRSTPQTIAFITDVIQNLVKLPLRGLQDQKAMQNVALRKYKDMLYIVRPRNDLQAFAKIGEAHPRSWLVHFTCCNMKCGGKAIPSTYCDPMRYDFRYRNS
jgi:hypothetical protein